MFCLTCGAFPCGYRFIYAMRVYTYLSLRWALYYAVLGYTLLIYAYNLAPLLHDKLLDLVCRTMYIKTGPLMICTTETICEQNHWHAGWQIVGENIIKIPEWDYRIPPPDPGLELLMEEIKAPGLTRPECPIIGTTHEGPRNIRSKQPRSQNVWTPTLELELLTEDLENSISNQPRMPPPQNWNTLMEDFVWWISVWRLPLYPQLYGFLVRCISYHFWWIDLDPNIWNQKLKLISFSLLPLSLVFGSFDEMTCAVNHELSVVFVITIIIVMVIMWWVALLSTVLKM